MLELTGLRNWIARQARRLPPPRDTAATTALRALRDLASGRHPTVAPLEPEPEAETISTEPRPYGTVPGPPLPPVEPIDKDAPWTCLLYTSPSPRDRTRSRMPSSA